MLSLSDWLGLKPTVVDASMFIGSPVDGLRTVRAARRFLSEEQLTQFAGTLGNESKHMHALGEMAPAARVTDAVQGAYEVSGQGAGNRTIGWLFSPKGDDAIEILFDVK